MDELKQMATREGFLEVFWNRLKCCRRLGKLDSMRQIYSAMEQEFASEYGREPFPSFEAFKVFFYRNTNKK